VGVWFCLDATQQLLDENIIQYVIKKTTDPEAFQKTVIETINGYLEMNRTANEGNVKEHSPCVIFSKYYLNTVSEQ